MIVLNQEHFQDFILEDKFKISIIGTNLLLTYKELYFKIEPRLRVIEMNHQLTNTQPLNYYDRNYTKFPQKKQSHRYKISIIQPISSKDIKNQPKINSQLSCKKSLKKIANTKIELQQKKPRYQIAHNYHIAPKLFQQSHEQNTKISIRHIDSSPRLFSKTNSLSKDFNNQYFSRREIRKDNEGNGHQTQPAIFNTNNKKQILREHAIFQKIKPKTNEMQFYNYTTGKNSMNFSDMKKYFNPSEESSTSCYDSYKRNPESLNTFHSQQLTNVPTKQVSQFLTVQQPLEMPIVKINRNAKKIRQFRNSTLPQETQKSSKNSSRIQIFNQNSVENDSRQTQKSVLIKEDSKAQNIRMSTKNFSQNNETDMSSILPSFFLIQPFQQLFLCLKCKEYFPTIQIKFHQNTCQVIKQQIQLTKEQNKQVIFMSHNQFDKVMSRQPRKQKETCQNCFQVPDKKHIQFITTRQKLYKLAELLKTLSQIGTTTINFKSIKIKASGNSVLKQKFVNVNQSSLSKYKLISNYLLDYLKKINQSTFFLRSQNTMYNILAILGIMSDQQSVLNKQNLLDLIRDLINTIEKLLQDKESKKILLQTSKTKYFQGQTPYFCFF